MSNYMGSLIDWDAVEERNRKDRYADNYRRKKQGIKTFRDLGIDPAPLPVRIIRAAEKTEDTVCPVCHKPFTRSTSSLARLQTFCSEGCRMKELARRKREQYATKRARLDAMVERANEKTTERGMCECPECGGTFFPRKQGRAQKFCSHTCAQRAANRRYRERHGY